MPFSMCKKLPWIEATNYCNELGGRLCTKKELEANCAAGTGCNTDGMMVWSSDSSHGATGNLHLC